MRSTGSSAIRLDDDAGRSHVAGWKFRRARLTLGFPQKVGESRSACALCLGAATRRLRDVLVREHEVLSSKQIHLLDHRVVSIAQDARSAQRALPNARESLDVFDETAMLDGHVLPHIPQVGAGHGFTMLNAHEGVDHLNERAL